MACEDMFISKAATLLRKFLVTLAHSAKEHQPGLHMLPYLLPCNVQGCNVVLA